MMDEWTEKHFQNWLKQTVHDEERKSVESKIRSLVNEHPDLLDRLSWPEMRNLSER